MSSLIAKIDAETLEKSYGKIDSSDCSAGVADANYIHQQANPSDTWVIEHGLNKVPSIVVYDSSGTCFELFTRLLDDNFITKIHFGAAFSGSAYCN